MNDLREWDFAIDFTGVEAAALIVGENPTIESDDRKRPVVDRMRRAYESKRRHYLQQVDPNSEGVSEKHQSQFLSSDAMARYYSNYVDCVLSGIEDGREQVFWNWLKRDVQSGFEAQRFTRGELSRWLRVIGMTSAYNFALAEMEPAAQLNSSAFDPSDLPDELDAANIAFRAVIGGYGDENDTFREKLIAFLKKNYAGLGSEALDRIATVANLDKTPGRKKSHKK
jgi:hypothetical protein